MCTVGKLITLAIPASSQSVNCVVHHRKFPPAIRLSVNRGHGTLSVLLTSPSSPSCGLVFPPVGVTPYRGLWLIYGG